MTGVGVQPLKSPSLPSSFLPGLAGVMSREGGETDGERHAGDGHCREARAEVRWSRPGTLWIFPAPRVSLLVGREEEWGVRSKAQRLKRKPLAASPPPPPPQILAEPHFPESRGSKGKPAVLLPGGMAHAGLTAGFNHPLSALQTLSSYMAWLFAQVTSGPGMLRL